MEAEIRTYSSEIDRLKELSKKVVEGASVAPAFVSVCVCVCGGGVYVCGWSPSMHLTFPLSHYHAGPTGSEGPDGGGHSRGGGGGMNTLSPVARPSPFTAFTVNIIPSRISSHHQV